MKEVNLLLIALCCVALKIALASPVQLVQVHKVNNAIDKSGIITDEQLLPESGRQQVVSAPGISSPGAIASPVAAAAGGDEDDDDDDDDDIEDALDDDDGKYHALTRYRYDY